MSFKRKPLCTPESGARAEVTLVHASQSHEVSCHHTLEHFSNRGKMGKTSSLHTMSGGLGCPSKWCRGCQGCHLMSAEGPAALGTRSYQRLQFSALLPPSHRWAGSPHAEQRESLGSLQMREAEGNRKKSSDVLS